MSFFNTHTHIFNVPSVPDAFLTNYRIPPIIGRMLRSALNKKWLRKIILGLLNKLPVKVGGIQLRRYAALVDVALHKSQEEVFNILSSNYPAEARFVFLTMNFDFMTGEAPKGNYNLYPTQLVEAIEIRNYYGQKAIPFIFIDPRDGEANCMKLLNKYFNSSGNLGVGGVKIYPSMGYYPFHPNMDNVYAFAEANQIPIVTHAYKDGGAYYTGKFTPAVMSYNSFNTTTETSDYLNHVLKDFSSIKSDQDFANILMHPMTYYDVLRKYKKLKICLAHFGGAVELLNQNKTDDKNKYNWTRTIKNLMIEFDNVYTDVSFTLKEQEANKIILADMADPVLSKKILFGTDFFMTAPFATDKELTDNFSNVLKPYMNVLTNDNPEQFLTSKFFNP